MDWNIFDLLMVAMMFISCIWVGVIYKNVSEKSFKSYFTADGKLPLSILTGTLMSTFFSGVIIIGFGGKAASSGIVMWVGSLGLIYVMRYPIFIVAQAARNKFPPGVYTLPDFCGHYYGKTAGGLAALLNLIYNMVRYATQMLAVATLFKVVFGLDIFIGLVIAAIILLSYTMSAGVWGVATTGFIQAVVMCIGTGLACAYIFGKVGGFNGLTPLLDANTWDPLGGKSVGYWIAAMIGIGMSQWCAPELYQRFISGKNTKVTTYAWCWTVLIWVLFAACVGIPGLVARAFYSGMPGDDAVCKVYLTMLPAGFRGLWIASLLGATLSTASAHILLAGTNMSKDIYYNLFNPKISEKKLIFNTRVSIIVLGFLAIFIALKFENVFEMYLWGQWFMSAGLLIIIPGTLLWPGKVSKYAGLPTMLVGILTFLLIGKPIGPLGKNVAFMLSWASSLVVFITINLLKGEKINISKNSIFCKKELWQKNNMRVTVLGFILVVLFTLGYMISPLKQFKFDLYFWVTCFLTVLMGITLCIVFFKEYNTFSIRSIKKE